MTFEDCKAVSLKVAYATTTRSTREASLLSVSRIPCRWSINMIDLAHLRMRNILKQRGGINFFRLTLGLDILLGTDELSRPIGRLGRIARRVAFAIGKTRIAFDWPTNFLDIAPCVRELTRPAASLGQLIQSIALAICEKAHVPISYLQRRKRCGAPSPTMAAWEFDQLAVVVLA